jgi:hypothetical protein
MTIAPELVAQILRLHTVERWRAGTIARQLHVHRDAVRRVLAGNRAPVHTSPLRPSRVDPYRPFILATLEKFPTLTAARLHAMVVERGYAGGPSHFRLLVAHMRPRPPAEAYLRLRTLPGEQAQVDWGHFGHLQIGRARRSLMAFVMVLSHQFVMGGAVRGGEIYGSFPTLVARRPGASDCDSPDLVRNGALLPTTSIDQLGATLGRWFGLSDAQALEVFPNLANFSAGSRYLGFMG